MCLVYLCSVLRVGPSGSKHLIDTLVVVSTVAMDGGELEFEARLVGGGDGVRVCQKL